MKVLITCPPMLRSIDRFRPIFAELGVEITTPDVVQVLSEPELIALVPQFDGWIIGDDPATARVFEAGKSGRLKAAVKWGVGVDNVDFVACDRLGILVSNTPGAFGREVADLAFSYVVALARQSFAVDHAIKRGEWPKPVGVSLAGKTVALVGFGDIGRNIAKRLLLAEMTVLAYDPRADFDSVPKEISLVRWPERIVEAEFIVLACALNSTTFHLVGRDILNRCRGGVRIVNVARGSLIDEAALVEGLKSGHVHSAALDVFEEEPLPKESQLREFASRCVFGSHNASNTAEAVERTSIRAIELLKGFLKLPG
jgi:D-3-phosphoglycerate dehydrogenase / 2-oxoglutarate reductase